LHCRKSGSGRCDSRYRWCSKSPLGKRRRWKARRLAGDLLLSPPGSAAVSADGLRQEQAGEFIARGKADRAQARRYSQGRVKGTGMMSKFADELVESLQ